VECAQRVDTATGGVLLIAAYRFMQQRGCHMS
jgi:hypothetical protein